MNEWMWKDSIQKRVFGYVEVGTMCVCVCARLVPKESKWVEWKFLYADSLFGSDEEA